MSYSLRGYLSEIVKAIFPNRIVVFLRNLELKITKRRRLAKRKTLYFDVHVVDHCNLNCKGCDNFSNISDEKYHNIEKLEKDFVRIHELANEKIESMSLMGGEPLLHPDLLKILNIAGKYFGKTDIKLFTNGILLEKQPPEFWASCKRNNIKISITRYPIKLPIEKIKKLGEEHGVFIQNQNATKITLKRLYKLQMNLEGSANPRKSFEYCHRANKCITLDDGKIYTCAIIPYIKYFNKHFSTNMEVCEKDYIDIYKASNIDEIFEFLRKPMPFCRYCNTNKTVYFDWAVSRKEISEYI
jgi:MoaA/NifB/PqqE/SkfB family radical SAM enzyme